MILALQLFLVLGVSFLIYKGARKAWAKTRVQEKIDGLESDLDNLETVQKFKATHKSAEKAKDKVDEFLGK